MPVVPRSDRWPTRCSPHRYGHGRPRARNGYAREGTGRRIHDLCLPGRRGRLRQLRLRKLRHTRDEVEAGLQPARAGAAWARHRKRASAPAGSPTARSRGSSSTPRPGRRSRACAGRVMPSAATAATRCSSTPRRPDASAVPIKNVRANRNCPRPDAAQASSWPRLRAYDLGGATRIVQRVVCVGAPSREFCSARGQNYIRTFAAEATVVDGSAHRSESSTDSPLARGEWVSGQAELQLRSLRQRRRQEALRAHQRHGARDSTRGPATTRSASPVRAARAQSMSTPRMRPKAPSR